jgi:hypothetical protein
LTEALVPDSSHVPEHYLHRTSTAKDIPLHEHAFVSAGTIKVDIDRQLWINPGAVYARDAAKLAPPQVGIVRVEEGFKVTLDKQLLGHHVWEVDSEFCPPNDRGIRWLRVIAIDEV